MDIPDTSRSDASPHASLPHYILHKGETIIASDQYEAFILSQTPDCQLSFLF